VSFFKKKHNHKELSGGGGGEPRPTVPLHQWCGDALDHILQVMTSWAGCARSMSIFSRRGLAAAVRRGRVGTSALSRPWWTHIGSWSCPVGEPVVSYRLCRRTSLQ
jgi:hypothetical protein